MHHIKKYIGYAGIILPLIALLSPLPAKAAQLTSSSEESFYRYNALENKNSVALMYNLDANDLAIAVPAEENATEKIAEEIDATIERQDYLRQEINEFMSKIESGSDFGKFLIGSKVGMLRLQLVEIKDQIYKMQQLDGDAVDMTNKAKIETQIALAGEDKEKIENFLAEQEKKFSLLGWFTKVL